MQVPLLQLMIALVYPSEIAPLKYRHVGGAAGAFGEWSMTFVTGKDRYPPTLFNIPNTL